MTKELREEYQASFILIGPVIFQNPDVTQIQEILKVHHLPVSLTMDIMEYYNRIPLLPSFDFYFSLLSPMLRTLYHENLQFTTILISDPNALSEANTIKQNSQDREVSFEAIEQRYKA